MSAAFSSSHTSFQPDVLIVGGAMAALTAALAVTEEGRSVAIISRAPIGRSGNTLISGAGISGATADPENDAATYLKDLLTSGQGVADPVLTARLANDSAEMLLYLEKHGLQFMRDGSGFVRRRPPGHSVPRNVPTDWTGIPYAIKGITYMKPLVDKLRTHEKVTMLNGLRAVSLLRDDNGIAGVVAYAHKTKNYHVLRARRIILATGGYGCLFRRTNNVAGILGDGVAMALDAGCTVRDMELVQFFPTMMYTPKKMTIPNPLFGAGAVLRNKDGERFMSRYDPKGDTATRDSMARSIFLEAAAGRGVDGCAYVDCTDIPLDVLRSQFGAFCNTLSKYGLDPAKDWLLGTPSTHYTIGGIRIDEYGRTDIPGLYAAGEVAGGVHGVNRVSGAALMEACVFGRQAGLAASSDAFAGPASVALDLPELSENPNDSGEAAQLHVLRDLLWDNVSLAREEKGIKKAIAGVENLRDAEYAKPCGRHSIFAKTLFVAEAVAKSALMRTESRGAHYRTDYFATDPAWTKPVFCSLQNGALVVSA